MKIEGEWLTSAAEVLGMLEAAGHAAFCVGGCVRNALLDAPVADVDIATDAPPETVVALARAAGFDPVPTGIDHGTVTVVAGGQPFEVTTFRRDVETDGRHAVVQFSGDVAEDAARRDFTMNALYARADGEVIDPLGGLPDLRARIVRFIGRPEDRIREDYLRILRFFRFTALYGDPAVGLEPEALAACAALAEGLERVSAERIGHEMRKLLAARDPAPAVAAMAQTGILARVLPGADASVLAPLVHVEAEPDWRLRLAALGGDVAGLRLSRAETREVAALASAAREGIAPFALGDLMGDRGADVLVLRAALTGQAVDPDELRQAKAGQDATFPLRAADLMPALTGAELGAALASARQAWRESAGTLTREDLLQHLRGAHNLR